MTALGEFEGVIVDRESVGTVTRSEVVADSSRDGETSKVEDSRGRNRAYKAKKSLRQHVLP